MTVVLITATTGVGGHSLAAVAGPGRTSTLHPLASLSRLYWRSYLTHRGTAGIDLVFMHITMPRGVVGPISTPAARLCHSTALHRRLVMVHRMGGAAFPLKRRSKSIHMVGERHKKRKDE
jgi:hypothetical protein